MIQLKEEDYVLGAWFCPGEDRDWLCVVYRKAGSRDLVGDYRFRYDAPDDGEQKHWYHLDLTRKTEEAAIAAIDDLASSSIAHGPGFLGVSDRALGLGTADNLVRTMLRKGWVNSMTVGGARVAAVPA